MCKMHLSYIIQYEFLLCSVICISGRYSIVQWVWVGLDLQSFMSQKQEHLIPVNTIQNMNRPRPQTIKCTDKKKTWFCALCFKHSYVIEQMTSGCDSIWPSFIMSERIWTGLTETDGMCQTPRSLSLSVWLMHHSRGLNHMWEVWDDIVFLALTHHLSENAHKNVQSSEWILAYFFLHTVQK